MTFVSSEKHKVTQPCLPDTFKTDSGVYSPPLRASQKSLGAKLRTRDSDSSLLHRRHPGASVLQCAENTGSLGCLVTAEGERIKQLHNDAVTQDCGCRAEPLPNMCKAHIVQPSTLENRVESQQCPHHSTPTLSSQERIVGQP